MSEVGGGVAARVHPAAEDGDRLAGADMDSGTATDGVMLAEGPRTLTDGETTGSDGNETEMPGESEMLREGDGEPVEDAPMGLSWQEKQVSSWKIRLPSPG